MVTGYIELAERCYSRKFPVLVEMHVKKCGKF